MIHYLIAKYVDDLARNEPRNVGVIAYDGAAMLARFDGEDDQGRMDLRRVKGPRNAAQTFRAWVDYWRAAIDEPHALDRALRDVSPGDVRIADYLLELPSQDFYLERGGTILLDGDELSLYETLTDLFARLVRVPDAPASPSLGDKSRTAIAAAGVRLDDARFEVDVPVTLEFDGGVKLDENVSYAVTNGKRHYLQEMPFDPGKPTRSQKEASHCVVLFEHSAEIRDSGLVLYDRSSVTAEQYRLLELLMLYAPVVNVNDVDGAAAKLRTHLQVGEPH